MLYSAADLDSHKTHPHHPEHQRRITAALAGVGAAGLLDATEWREAPEASDAELALVHDDMYIDGVRRFCECGGGNLDPDTMVSSGSFATARRAAGGVLASIAALRGRRVRCRVLGGQAAWASRPARPGDGVLPVQQRRDRRRRTGRRR